MIPSSITYLTLLATLVSAEPQKDKGSLQSAYIHFPDYTTYKYGAMVEERYFKRNEEDIEEFRITLMNTIPVGQETEFDWFGYNHVYDYQLGDPLWKSTCHVKFTSKIHEDYRFDLRDQTAHGLEGDKGTPVSIECPPEEYECYVPGGVCEGDNQIPYVSTSAMI